MDMRRLAELCAQSINTCTQYGVEVKQANINLTMKTGWRRPPRFPRGRLLQEKEDGTVLRAFPAMDVLAWMAANGLVNISDRTEEPVTGP